MDASGTSLADDLMEQLDFLESSASSYDRGFEGEAKRLAVVIRVLVHDTRHSTSLLEQLDVKSKMRFVDTAEHPPAGAILLGSAGLAIQRMRTGPGGEGRYVPPLDNLPPNRLNAPAPFNEWWERPVLKDVAGTDFNRKGLVLTTANQAGGAHIDPTLDPAYEALAKRNAPGWIFEVDGREPEPFRGDAALASVRQIAYELDQTIRSDLAHILDPSTLSEDRPLPRVLRVGVGRNDLCPCGGGKKFKRCHGAGT